MFSDTPCKYHLETSVYIALIFININIVALMYFFNKFLFMYYISYSFQDTKGFIIFRYIAIHDDLKCARAKQDID